MILQPLLCLPFGVSFAAPSGEDAGEGLTDAVVLYVDLRLRLSIQIASLFLSAIITPFILPPAPFRGKIKGRSGALVCLSFFITVVGMGNLRDTVLGAGNTGGGFYYFRKSTSITRSEGHRTGVRPNLPYKDPMRYPRCCGSAAPPSSKRAGEA